MPSIPLRNFKVPLQEVDHAGVLFFAHLFIHAHDAYAQLMESMGFPLQQIIQSGAYHIPLAHAEADFLAPMRHGQLVEVQAHIERLGNTSFTLKYEFRSNTELCALVSTRHVIIDPHTGRSLPVPDKLRRELAAHK